MECGQLTGTFSVGQLKGHNMFHGMEGEGSLGAFR